MTEAKYVKTDGPVPEYLTAGKVYEALPLIDPVNGESEFGGRITDDDGHIRNICYTGSVHLYDRDWTLCDQHGNPVAENSVVGADMASGPDETIYTSRTDYKAERDRYKALAGELAEALRDARYTLCEKEPVAYKDEAGRTVRISEDGSGNGGFVGHDRAIPDAWTPLYIPADIGKEG
jgi:hypothetical protein